MKRDNLENVLMSIKTRMTGKTSLIKKGIDNYDKPFWVYVRTIKEGRQLTTNPNAQFITPSTTEKLRGSRLPIIVEQEGMLDLFKENEELTKYLKYLADSRYRVCHELFDLVDLYQERAHKLESLLLDGLHIKWYEFKKRREHKLKCIKMVEADFNYQEKFDKIKQLLK